MAATLIIGGTGYIGKFIVEASVKAGHPTFALVRESTASDPVKGKLIEIFKNLGVNVLYGDLQDHESLIKAIKQVDVVISMVSRGQIPEQAKIIAAVKEAGNVKRFLPSEFGNDVDRSQNVVEPVKSVYADKIKIRRAIEAEGIPYTYVSCNCFAGYFLPTLAQNGATAPPREKVTIFGDGNARDAQIPLNVLLAITYATFVKGDQANFEINTASGVEASELYPEVKNTTVEEYLDQIAV
ncbi:hypothetical protein WN943_008512 [Citrus x changshan-huyou]